MSELRCSKCGEIAEKLFPSFGKEICIKCKNNRPNKGTGNSGMFTCTNDYFEDNSSPESLFDDDTIELRMVPKSNKLFGYLFFTHYPESKGIVGRSLCYLIYKGSNLIGIIGASSPPIKYKVFSTYFGENNETKFMNNNVFRLTLHEPNIGTKILKAFRNQIKKDYEHKYKEKLIGIATFVELPRTGALYKADNWDYLGLTQGKRVRRDSDTWEKTYVDGELKHIFGYKYKNFK